MSFILGPGIQKNLKLPNLTDDQEGPNEPQEQGQIVEGQILEYSKEEDVYEKNLLWRLKCQRIFFIFLHVLFGAGLPCLAIFTSLDRK